MEIPPIPSRQNPNIRQYSPIRQNNIEEKKPNFVEGINLKMTAKGKYYWEIQAYGELNIGLVRKISAIDEYLKKEFPNNATTESQ
jgi:hypothetical protein